MSRRFESERQRGFLSALRDSGNALPVAAVALPAENSEDVRSRGNDGSVESAPKVVCASVMMSSDVENP